MSHYLKDPDEKLDYAVDWSLWLANEGDTVGSVEWIVPTGITKVLDSVVGGAAIIWLEGGTIGRDYDVTCRLTTDGARVKERTITIMVRRS